MLAISTCFQQNCIRFQRWQGPLLELKKKTLCNKIGKLIGLVVMILLYFAAQKVLLKRPRPLLRRRRTATNGHSPRSMVLATNSRPSPRSTLTLVPFVKTKRPMSSQVRVQHNCVAVNATTRGHLLNYRLLDHLVPAQTGLLKTKRPLLSRADPVHPSSVAVTARNRGHLMTYRLLTLSSRVSNNGNTPS